MNLRAHKETETRTQTEQPTKSIILYPLWQHCELFVIVYFSQTHATSFNFRNIYTENHFYANIIFMLFSLSNNKTEKYFRVISHAHTPHRTVWDNSLYNCIIWCSSTEGNNITIYKKPSIFLCREHLKIILLTISNTQMCNKLNVLSGFRFLPYLLVSHF